MHKARYRCQGDKCPTGAALCFLLVVLYRIEMHGTGVKIPYRILRYDGEIPPTYTLITTLFLKRTQSDTSGFIWISDSLGSTVLQQQEST